MKNLKFFPLSEWIVLEPLRAFLKQLRNDLLLTGYKNRKAKYEDQFIHDNQHLSGQNILVVIAFEQPQVLEWLFQLSKKNLKDFHLLVFDNSKNSIQKKLIKEICKKNTIPYLELPDSFARHPNRSHGLAMTWVFHRIIKKIQPLTFGFLDHDMYPIKPINQADFFPKEQNFYGLINESANYWNLWAGYCFYRFSSVSSRPLNFLYDFSRGVDTGGRNWPYLYQGNNKSLIKFANYSEQVISLGDDYPNMIIHLIDESWVHVGGVGYGDNFNKKGVFHQELVERLANDVSVSGL
jgi:hypothetical protein